ncbi:hypothetical protein V1515DRAFT_644547 [Lipomyces mesembrius]
MSGFFSTEAARRPAGFSEAEERHDSLQKVILSSGQPNTKNDRASHFSLSAQSHGLQFDLLSNVNQKFAFGPPRIVEKEQETDRAQRHVMIEYRCFPPEAELADMSRSYIANVAALNVEVALKMSYPVVCLLLNKLSVDAHDIELSLDTRIQVLNTLDDLPRARKYQYAAFIRSDQCLVIWAESIRDIVSFGAVIESKMVDTMWETDISPKRGNRQFMHRGREDDLESGEELLEQNRPVKVMQELSVAVAIVIMMTFYGFLFRTIVMEIKADGNYLRILAILYLPPSTLFCAFFCVVVSGIVFQLLGAVSQLKTNSVSYSAIPPKRISPNDGISRWCHRPYNAISPRRGDNLRITKRDGEYFCQRRRITAMSRGPHGQIGFVRKGRFKQASSMDYCLNVSNKVEQLLEAAHSRPEAEKWTDKDEIEAYEEVLASVARHDQTC